MVSFFGLIHSFVWWGNVVCIYTMWVIHEYYENGYIEYDERLINF